MTDVDRAKDSLLAALTKARIPAENHVFIRRMVDAVGVCEYRAVARADNPYVIARRTDGSADLHIHYGYTNGFRSEDEINRFIGGSAGRAPSSRKGTWYVEHPTNRVRPAGSERLRDTRREAGFCGCGMLLSLTGACGSCD
ncbi:hypothetical protein [Mycobacterium sp. GA-2829]|uniref:hypothetical protein n=1 Tax=Mycobacterium sp. GA-2829 TaxID=1772283 RepID=UPI00073FFCC1|nr:hypothetical protein [Mycobacterium sp. GA-2829]KUI22286.1 hypothetical protein AU194_05990 [Mycobacterium sp. GA-2829]